MARKTELLIGGETVNGPNSNQSDYDFYSIYYLGSHVNLMPRTKQNKQLVTGDGTCSAQSSLLFQF